MKNFLVLVFMLSILNVSGQINSALDSTVYYLNQFTGSQKTDTVFLKRIYVQISSVPASILGDPGFLQAMKRLKGLLTKDEYYALCHYFLQFACYTSIDQTHDYPINYGYTFIEELKSYTSVNQYYALLQGMRDLRVPIRNSDRIYEGIEKYSTLYSYFNQRHDSSAVSIVDNVLASFYNTLGITDKAINLQLRSIDYLNDQIIPYDTSYLGYQQGPNIGLYGKLNRKSVLGSYYIDDGNLQKALQQLYDVFTLNKKGRTPEHVPEPVFVYLQIARVHTLLKTDSIDYYFSKMLENIDTTSPYSYYELAHYYQEKSFGYYQREMLDSAQVNIQKCIDYINEWNLPISSIIGHLTPAYYLALVRVNQGRPAEAIDLLNEEIIKLSPLNLKTERLQEIKLLAEAYTLNNDFKNATHTYEDYYILLAEMMAEEKNNRSISFEIEKRMAENEKAVLLLESENKYSRKKQYYLLGILGLVGILAFGLLTRNQYKQKINKQLLRKNQEIETTLIKLQSTQALLIQSEKMASLGQVTAGIAHEIQNPLNFINNFSDVNKELLVEMKDEMGKGNYEETTALANVVIANEEKINHHGRRADAIVKGMLQHSRTSNGVKEPTDINALTDEYLRLAYHGFRAKDNSFNATMKTDYDDNIGMVNVIPQDIGRVILNLITNAFYVVDEKKKNLSNGFEPTVSVTTKKTGQHIIVIVKDNGSGIPKEAMSKIFQPFFTTKPTGQGTGLGLSLSYDIVKAHGGELKVETVEGEGSVFNIILPL